MAAVLQMIASAYNVVFVDYVDPRSADWFLAASPLAPACIMGFYLYFVKVLGPHIMKNRPPFDLRRIITFFNIVQIVVCAEVIRVGVPIFLTYNPLCQPVDHEVNETNTKIANYVYLYYVIKLLDLMDTVFFILRKKFSQASFLHIYHHFGMVLVSYMACKYSLNGHFIAIGILNSFVHVMMYTYYLLSALSPKYKEKLWWKKYITILQLIQFAVLAVHTSLPLIQPNCKVQKIWSALLLPQFAFMTMMFADFYRRAYMKKKE